MSNCQKPCMLLNEEDSSPFESIRSAKPSPLLIICDHASNAVPAALMGLGIDAKYLGQHIAYDIGAANVSRTLASLLKASVVLSGFSRLVIDPNRYLSTADAIPERADNVRVKGNENLSSSDIALRVEELFMPYHFEINSVISNICANYTVPFIISIHSFTPQFQGVKRSWELGVLWDDDKGLGLQMIDILREETAFNIGDNQPYHACDPVIYSLKTHADAQAYPHILIEIRQDMIEDETGQVKIAKVLANALQRLISSSDSLRNIFTEKSRGLNK